MDQNENSTFESSMGDFFHEFMNPPQLTSIRDCDESGIIAQAFASATVAHRQHAPPSVHEQDSSSAAAAPQDVENPRSPASHALGDEPSRTALYSAVELSEEAMDVKTWRIRRRELLAEFLEDRLLTPHKVSSYTTPLVRGSPWQSPVRRRHRSTPQKEPTQQAPTSAHQEGDDQEYLETQQQHPVDPPMATAASHVAGQEDDEDTHGDEYFLQIPHVAEATREVSYLPDIDLFTKNLRLALTQVIKVWPKRETKRLAVTGALPRRLVLYKSNLEWPRLDLPYCQDDGPLSSCYNSVINIEITQLNPPLSETRQRAQQLQDDTARRAQRLKVFFYNAYASRIHAIWQSRPDGCDRLLLSLMDVPAKCIVPYSASDWFDRLDLSPYCLVIGDESSMRIENDETAESKLVRFDDGNLRIHVAWAREDEMVTLHNIVPNIDKGAVDTEVPVRDFDQYQCFRQICEAKATTTQDRNDPPNVHPTNVAGGGQVVDITNTGLAGAEDSRTSVDTSAPCDTVETDLVNQHSKMTDPPPQPPPNRTDQVARLRPPEDVQEKPKPSSKRAREMMAPPGLEQMEMDVKYELLNDLRLVYDTHMSLATGPNSLRGSPCLVSCYGAVLGFSPPSLTKRGDWMMGLVLVDESLPLAAEEGSLVETVKTVNINIFTKSRDDLPQVRFAGDVVRIHRAMLQLWQNEVQLMGTRSGSYVVFRGNVNDPASTTDGSLFPTAKNEFYLVEKEKKRFKELWQWAQKRLLSHPTTKISHMFQLGDMKLQSDHQVFLSDDATAGGDLTVMICAIIPVPAHLRSGITPRGFCRVWDGTGPSVSDPLPQAVSSFSLSSGDPPTEALVKLATLIKKLQFVRQNPHLRPPQAVTGRVANVAVWEEPHWELAMNSLTVGAFCRLRNIQDRRLSETEPRYLMVHAKSSLTPLPNMTYEVVRLIEEHNQRLLRNEPLNPHSGVLPLDPEELRNLARTATRHERPIVAPPSQPPTRREEKKVEHPRPAPPGQSHVDSLKELIAGPVPSVFIGEVNIMSMLPTPEITSLEDLCPWDRTGKRRVYRFALQVTDGVEEITAVVGDDSTVGPTLSGGYSASQVMASREIWPQVGKNFLEAVEGHVPKQVWRTQVRSVLFKGAKFFMMDWIQAAS